VRDTQATADACAPSAVLASHHVSDFSLDLRSHAWDVRTVRPLLDRVHCVRSGQSLQDAPNLARPAPSLPMQSGTSTPRGQHTVPATESIVNASCENIPSRAEGGCTSRWRKRPRVRDAPPSPPCRTSCRRRQGPKRRATEAHPRTAPESSRFGKFFREGSHRATWDHLSSRPRVPWVGGGWFSSRASDG